MLARAGIIGWPAGIAGLPRSGLMGHSRLPRPQHPRQPRLEEPLREDRPGCHNGGASRSVRVRRLRCLKGAKWRSRTPDQTPDQTKTRWSPSGSFRAQSVEATTGFEPVNRGFADLRVEPLHHVATCGFAGELAPDAGCPSRIRTSVHGSKVRCPTTRRRGSGPRRRNWSGRRDSNPRPSPWQGDALPTEPLPPEDPPTRWVVPRARFELATPRFSVACSTN